MVRLKEKQTTGGGDDEEIGEITLTAASFTAVTDENGIAEFNDVPPGTYSVFVSYEGASTTPQSLTLQSIRNVNCTIQFKKSFN